MSCNNSNCYLPIPPRAWSRVQNECAVVTNFPRNFDELTSLVPFPYTKQLVVASTYRDKLNMLRKGNILQYKANSSNLTKNMKYSKIAQGQWTNRNTTWATQSTRGYTNPNTTSLKRIAKVNIAFDPITRLPLGPTFLPVTCPKIETNTYPALPISTGTGTSNIVLPPLPPTPANNDTFIPPVAPIPVPDPIVIQDEGNLICSIQENICTGYIKRSLSQQICNPTSDSDVPGQIQELCWNDGTPTWYPRQRYTMSNSGNKWPYTTGPVDTTTISAVRPFAPDITFISSNCSTNTVTLFWEQNETCLPVSSFLIYENDVLIKISEGFERSTELTIENDIEYSYFIISKCSGSNNLISDPSNTKTISKTSVQINQTIPGTYSYTIPKGATCYDVTVIGGGVGDFSTSNNISITSQTIFNYTVGQGVTRGNDSYNSFGNLSSFSDGLNPSITCNGGNSTGNGVVNITIYILNRPDELTYKSSLILTQLSQSTRKKDSLKSGITTVGNIKNKIKNSTITITSITNTTTYYEQPSTGFIELPNKSPKNGVLQICNLTDSELIIKSTHIIYNIVFAMYGEKKIELPPNTVANFTYLTDPKGNINIQAHIF